MVFRRVGTGGVPLSSFYSFNKATASSLSLEEAGRVKPRGYRSYLQTLWSDPRKGRGRAVFWLPLAFFCTILVLYLYGLGQLAGEGTAGFLKAPDTLVIYIFSNTDPEYERNMRFFVRSGIKEDDGCQYVFVVQHGQSSQPVDLPKLPSNAAYVHHDNECFDWGTIGWLLSESKVDTSLYKYFIFMNSSVRGPFLPTYWRGSSWSKVFTGMLSNETKLVGPTISCEGANKAGDPMAEWRQNPHIQSYLLATDAVGLEVLQKDGQVFSCYDSLHDTIFYSELGASLAIVKAGYNLGSLMERYQGVDWRLQRNWQCNAGLNPYAENHYDGLSLDPYELIFVKVKSYLLDLQWNAATKAAKYDGWANARQSLGPGQEIDVSTNLWADNADRYRLPKMLALQTVGGHCFDVPYYLEKNPDLTTWPEEILFAHFAFNGQFEGRPFRYLPNCYMDYKTAAWKLINYRYIIYDRGIADGEVVP